MAGYALAGAGRRTSGVDSVHFQRIYARNRAHDGPSTAFESYPCRQSPDSEHESANKLNAATAYRMREFPVSGGPVWID